MIKKSLIVAALAMSMVACGPNPSFQQPGILNTENPVQQIPQPQTGIDGSSAAIGAVAGAVGGYMMGRSSNSRTTTIIQQAPRTVYVRPSPPRTTVYRSTRSYSGSTTTYRRR